MMKKVLVLCLFIFFLIPFISAVEIEMNSEFDQGEILIVKISGSFTKSLTENNIFFYRGHTRTPTDFDFAKINEDFYISANLLGKTENNYSIVIKDARYMKAGQIEEGDLTRNFSITQNLADFSISPGFLTTKEDFSLQAQNLQDNEITITITGWQEETITLRSGEIRDIEFSVNNITTPILKTITLKTDNTEYEVPVYILELSEEIPGEEKEKSFRFEPASLNISMATNSETIRIIYLYNDGDAILENLSISISESLDDYVSSSSWEVDELKPSSSLKLTLEFTSDDEEKEIQGQLTAEHPDLIYAYLTIDLAFIQDYEPLPGEDVIEPVPDPAVKTCEEMGGVICAEGETCETEEYASDGKCCLETCLGSPEEPNRKVVGWLIIIAILLFLYWFFKRRYGRARRDINFLRIARGRR